MFRLIIFGLPVLTLLWWIWGHQRLGVFRHAGRWRVGLALFAAGQLAGYGWVLMARFTHLPPLPAVMLSAIYIWFLVVLPLAFAVALLDVIARGATRLVRGAARKSPEAARPVAKPETTDSPQRFEPGVSRRRLLAGALVAAPVVLLGGGVAQAALTRGHFRIRRIDVPLAGLPRELDGVTIAHLSDTHVGRISHGRLLDRIAAATNELRCDLVLFTGDLIDHSLADLPAALEMLRKIDPRSGLYICEGNHDLFEGREKFEERVLAGGFRLLLNEAAETTLRGYPVQVLGMKWGRGEMRGPLLETHAERTLALRNPAAFPILLAHHPHAFDLAADAGIPLTVAGHTHGGQLMLTDDIGAGPMLFKYWSGLYRRQNSALVVSNGAGNWFPLRVNAPAEIVHITLRSI